MKRMSRNRKKLLRAERARAAVSRVLGTGFEALHERFQGETGRAGLSLHAAPCRPISSQQNVVLPKTTRARQRRCRCRGGLGTANGPALLVPQVRSLRLQPPARRGECLDDDTALPRESFFRGRMYDSTGI